MKIGKILSIIGITIGIISITLFLLFIYNVRAPFAYTFFEYSFKGAGLSLLFSLGGLIKQKKDTISIIALLTSLLGLLLPIGFVFLFFKPIAW